MNSPVQDKPRILQVVASLRGGAAEHVLYLIEHTARLGWPTLLLAPDDCTATAEKLKKMPVRWIPLAPKAKTNPPLVQQCRQILESESISLVHFHGIRAGFFGRRALLTVRKRQGNIQSVYTVHGFHPAHYTNPVTRHLTLQMEKYFLSRCTDRLIFVSRSDRQIFEKKVAPRESKLHSAFVEKSRLIPNGVSFNIKNSFPGREQARKELNIPSGAYVILSVSRLNYQKAVHILVEATALLKDSIPNLVVLIAGDGPLQNKLEKLAEASGAEKNIRFLGYDEQPDRLYAAADVFVLTSLWEGLPLVLLEGAAAGLPLIATKVPGTVDVIEDDHTGLLVEKNNPAAVAEAIRKLYQSPEKARALGANALQKIPEKFSLASMLESTGSVYRELLENKNHPEGAP
jgi:glycosyltransferase EpsD